MVKSLLNLLFIIFISTGLTVNAQQNTSVLDSLIKISIEVSPRINMLKAKRDASFNRIEQNSNLPDPMLMLGFINLPVNSFSFTQEPMTGKIVGLSQMFPFPGKLSAIGEEAAIDTTIINEEIKDAENEIKKMMSRKYYDLNYFRRAIFFEAESKKLLEDILNVVSTKYAVSTASQQNLIKVQLEITNIAEKIEDLRSKENSALAEINALLLSDDARADVQTKLIDEIKYLKLDVQTLDSLARTYRPYLKGVRLAEQKARLKQNIAEFDYYPNFNLAVQYSFRDKIAVTGTSLNDFFSVALGISLPFNYGGKVSAKVEEAISLQSLFSEQYSLAMQSLDSDFGSAVADLNSLKERIKLFEEGLLPQAQQNFKSALASYQVNEVDFINVIDAEDQLFKIETNLYKLKIDYLKQIADLEFLVGTSLR